MNTLIEHSAGKERQLVTAADDTTILQDRLLSSEKAAVAAQSRASELSKVLRVSQIRSEELQEEIKRYAITLSHPTPSHSTPPLIFHFMTC